MTAARRPAQVQLLTAGLGVAALLVHLGVVRGLPAVEAPLRLPWWLLAAGFFLAESYVVHFHLRREAHTVSLSEIPLVLGLFFAAPGELVLAQLVGGGAALGLKRRQPASKLVFNLAHFWLETAVAAALFNRVVDLGNAATPLGWSGAFLATLASSCIGVAAVFLAISLSQGGVPLRKFPEELSLALLATVTNTSLALAAVMTVWSTPLAAWLLLVPTATLFLAYRAYISQRQKHDSLEFLYESFRLLHHAPDVELALLGLLSQARGTFRAELGEVILFPTTDKEPMLRTSVDEGDRIEQMVAVERAGDEERLAAMLRAGRARVLVTGAADRAGEEYLASRGLRSAMVAPLQGETRTIGALVLANRPGGVASFDSEDVRLFEALAAQVSVSLEHGRLEQSLTQLTKLKERLRHQAFHDTLTQLANRALLVDRVEHALSHRDPARRPLALLFVDLDDFKTINDSLGHQAGDEVLVAVAERIRLCLRPSDTPARLGGDEFAVLLEDVAEDAVAVAIADRIVRALSEPIRCDGREVTIRASVGIASSTPESRGADELLRNVDAAMYRAKSAGKGRYAIFEPAMHQAVVERLARKAELERAVDDSAFAVHYQPFVDLESGAILGLEALVRWRHPTRGLVAPGEFIGLAEETGLIRPIGDLVLRQACRDLRMWQRRHPEQRGLTMNVNLSPTQLQHPEVVDDVALAIEETGVEPQCLVLEITETLLMHDTELSVHRLHALRDVGVRLAIDDFGTGYSSLSYLRRFPIDILKIAKPFVDGIGTRSDDVAFADVIIQLGRILNVEIIAEGIERAEQRDGLRALGCSVGQGFHFARPGDASRIDALLDQRGEVARTRHPCNTGALPAG